MKTWTAYIDGGSRGNPGNAGYGVYVADGQGNPVAELSRNLGNRTNNQAEYAALIAVLEFARTRQIEMLQVCADSELLVNQILGLYKVKNPELQVLHQRARSLISGLKSFSIRHIPREQNREADRLANQAMDQQERPPRQSRQKPTGTRSISAVFQDGCFLPEEPLDIPDGSKFRLTLAPDKPEDLL